MMNLPQGDDRRQDLYETRKEAGIRLEDLFEQVWLGISRLELEVRKPLPGLRATVLDVRVAFLKVDEELDRIGAQYPEQQGWAIHLYDDLGQGLRGFATKPLEIQALRTYCAEWTEYLDTLLAEVTR